MKVSWHKSGIRPGVVLIPIQATAKRFTCTACGVWIFVFFLSGCSSYKLAGVEEYRKVTAEAQAWMPKALQALEQISASAELSPQVIANFSREVQHLEINSILIRARAQAIQSRGDAYFASWTESIANIKDSRVRELAENHHVELEKSFLTIKASSLNAGAAFRPFLTDLIRLRAELESRPGSALSPSQNTLIVSARENGEKVLKALGTISFELGAISSLLNPGKADARS
jgi:hypothetical protein